MLISVLTWKLLKFLLKNQVHLGKQLKVLLQKALLRKVVWNASHVLFWMHFNNSYFSWTTRFSLLNKKVFSLSKNSLTCPKQIVNIRPKMKIIMSFGNPILVVAKGEEDLPTLHPLILYKWRQGFQRKVYIQIIQQHRVYGLLKSNTNFAAALKVTFLCLLMRLTCPHFFMVLFGLTCRRI